MISMIVARAKNGVIGKNGAIPWHLPADSTYFRKVTRGKTVVMGGKTFQSIIDQNGKPLPGRKNVVLTRDESFAYPEVDVIHSPEDISKYPDLVIIGAFETLLPYADRLHITEVDATIEGDAFFPDIDPNEWLEISRNHHPKDAKNKYSMDFIVYERQ